MKQFKLVGLVFAGFIAGCVAAQLQLVVPPAVAGASHTKWDYTCTYVGGGNAFSRESIAEGTTANLKKYGLEGWELVTLEGSTVFACFKRPI